jgi:tripartite-type tricarboxylate transporter receptor subunit TctC
MNGPKRGPARIAGPLFALLLAVLSVLPPSRAGAQDAPSDKDPPFYKDKTIRLIISAGVAGGYVSYARLLAEHMGRHIPGNPSFIVQSMPGAGGLLATNYLFTQAPQDGTTIGLIHSTVPLAPLLGMTGARFDAMKIHWIGSMDRSDGPCTAWHTSPIKTWADMLEKEFIVGSSGVGSQMEIYPVVMNRLFGTKVKVIGGYKDGASIFHAMEREEIQGRCGPQLTSIAALRPQWLTEKKIAVPVVVSERRSPQFPDAPTLLELAKDEPTRQQIKLLIVSQDLDRPVLAPPGVPAERVKLLRNAFNATMNDPAFLADIKKQHLTLDWVRGEEVTSTLAAAYAMPPDVVAAAKSMMVGP